MLDSSCIFALISNIDEPRTIREAMGTNDADSWMEAMNEEMLALKKKIHEIWYLNIQFAFMDM